MKVKDYQYAKACKLAFSLIESLFVVAVIAVLLVAGLQVLSTTAEQAKIQTTAKDIQTWLKAGLIFTDQTSAELTSGTEKRATDAATLNQSFPEVLPQRNPWGQRYSALAVGPLKGNFAVSIDMPSKALAQKLLARLHFAEIIDATTVVAYAGSSTQPQLNRNIIVKQIGRIEGRNSGLGQWDNAAGDSVGGDSYRHKHYRKVSEQALRANGQILIDVPSCPAGMVPNVKVMLSGFQKGCHQEKNWFKNDWFCADTTNLYPSKTSFTQEVTPYSGRLLPGGKQWEFWVQTIGKSSTDTSIVDPTKWAGERDLPNYHGSLTYMTYCQGEAFRHAH